MRTLRNSTLDLAAALIGFLVAFSSVAGPIQSVDSIDELFSNADGKLQFIQLVDVTPQQLAGTSLTTTSAAGTQTFVFPATSNLPGPPRVNYLLIVSQSLSQRPLFGPGGGVSEWDYLVPDGFLPLNGGSISLGNLDRWDYGRVPTDSASALFRSGGVGLAVANSSQHGVVARFDIGDIQFVNEYVNPSLNRHFFTAFPAEIMALDSGQIPGWHLIYKDSAGGTGFAGYRRRVEAMSHEVCRFYLPPPSDSHFYTASEAECADVQARYPQLVLETSSALYAGLPDPVTGGCAPGLWSLYRLWNPVTNDHWYTADDEVRGKALSQGYVPEGYGPSGVGMCVIGTCFGNYC
jgi:hypothetical protein